MRRCKELAREIPAEAEGEVVGTAAGVCVKQGVPPRELDVAALQERLRARGVEP